MSDDVNPGSDGENVPGGGQARPTVEWTPTGEASDDAPTLTAHEQAQGVVRLWQPREVGIASFLLGFPGAVGVVARNAWRIGRRRTAFLYLAAGVVLLLVLLLLPIPRALLVALNTGIAIALYALVKRQIAVVTGRGGRAEPASGASGLATVIGGWGVVGVPAFAIAIALGGVGGTVHSGAMEFGTSGSGCGVDRAVTSTAAAAPLHYVAYLSREVKSGETINLALSEKSKGHLEDDPVPVDAAADCIFGTVPGGTLDAGSYTFELTVGSERVAIGSVVLTP